MFRNPLSKQLNIHTLSLQCAPFLFIKGRPAAGLAIVSHYVIRTSDEDVEYFKTKFI